MSGFECMHACMYGNKQKKNNLVSMHTTRETETIADRAEKGNIAFSRVSGVLRDEEPNPLP